MGCSTMTNTKNLRCDSVMFCWEMSCVRHIHNHKLGDNHGTKRIVVSQEIHVDEE